MKKICLLILLATCPLQALLASGTMAYDCQIEESATNYFIVQTQYDNAVFAGIYTQNEEQEIMLNENQAINFLRQLVSTGECSKRSLKQVSSSLETDIF